MASSEHLLIRKATTEDIPAITEIYNDAVLNGVATFDTEPKSVENRLDWFLQHGEPYPVLVAELEQKVIGWASLSCWSDRCAYNSTAEISVYFHPDYRGKGYGRQLMQTLLQAGNNGVLHTVIARITEGNKASIHLHEQLGFNHVGTLKEVGKKFGRMLDVHMLQKMY